MKIGELSKKTGLSVETIRYYESIKLISKPKTTENGYREYPINFVNTLCFIIKLKKSNFTLREIKTILKSKNCKNINQAVREKIKFLSKQINENLKVKEKLEKMLSLCPNKGSITDCTILKILNKIK